MPFVEPRGKYETRPRLPRISKRPFLIGGFRSRIDEAVVGVVCPLWDQSPVVLIDRIGCIVGDDLQSVTGGDIVAMCILTACGNLGTESILEVRSGDEELIPSTHMTLVASQRHQDASRQSTMNLVQRSFDRGGVLLHKGGITMLLDSERGQMMRLFLQVSISVGADGPDSRAYVSANSTTS